jgi:hypothetical protein
MYARVSQLVRECARVAKFRVNRQELCDFSKGYFATTFLSSTLTCPASQTRFYVSRQFACAFGINRFQGLEPYLSIAALVQFSVVKPCCAMTKLWTAAAPAFRESMTEPKQ